MGKVHALDLKFMGAKMNWQWHEIFNTMLDFFLLFVLFCIIIHFFVYKKACNLKTKTGILKS